LFDPPEEHSINFFIDVPHYRLKVSFRFRCVVFHGMRIDRYLVKIRILDFILKVDFFCFSSVLYHKETLYRGVNE
jgi:hypothetical protein